MIAIVLSFQLFNGLLLRHAVCLSKLFYLLLENREEFIFCYTAETVISTIETNILWLVETTEHTHLRELRYTSEKNELQVLVGKLKDTVEALEDISVNLLQRKL